MTNSLKFGLIGLGTSCGQQTRAQFLVSSHRQNAMQSLNSLAVNAVIRNHKSAWHVYVMEPVNSKRHVGD